MTESETLDLIKTALRKVEPKKAEQFTDIDPNTSIEDLGLDSLAMMEMVGYLEDHLETTFSDDEMARVDTIADLSSLVRTGRVPG
jgi:acyl carrier protein